MKVKELIERLKVFSPEAVVMVEYSGKDGCDTCGWGSQEEEDITRIVDLETRVIISIL